MHTDDFDYELPASAIAQKPAEPRDASRLLVVADPPIDTTFAKLPDYLEAGDLLVRNATRVRAARLRGVRPTGGGVEVLLLDKTGGEWKALARPARKLAPGMELAFGSLTATVTSVEGEGRVRLCFDVEPGVDLEARIAEVGAVPYPPYVTDGPTDPGRYQTVYASAVGSAAAPTAGLHFTDDLLEAIEGRGVAVCDVFLDIGLDTFRPIATAALEEHEMHAERFEVPAGAWDAIRRTHATGGRVVAVGTTVVRALEAAAATGELSGDTDLFIQPGYELQVVDALITNFHLPRSSLLVLLATVLPDWRRVYSHALDRGYRFLSFGDAMLLPAVR